MLPPDEPIFLPYQQAWICDRSPVKVCVKSRRIGITWATAYEAVEVATGAFGAERAQDFWYQTISADDAREFVEDVAKMARMAGHGITAIEQGNLGDFTDDENALLPDGDKSIKVTSIRFSSGKRVSTIAHHSRKIRGKAGVLCNDESAFGDDLEAVIKAGHALRMWGGRLIFISTQAEEDNPFNKLVEDIQNGVLSPKIYSLHTYTIHDAVAQGLYRRVCAVSGATYSIEGEKEYVSDLLTAPGAEAEYLCEPIRVGTHYIAGSEIKKAVEPHYKVLRLRLDDSFMKKSQPERAQHIKLWLDHEILPALKALGNTAHYVGQDFGRYSDLSVIAIGYLTAQRHLHVPLVIEMANVPYKEQEQATLYVCDNLPRRGFVALDGAGNGGSLGEAVEARYTEEGAEAVKASDAWYGSVLPALRGRFYNNTIRIPDDLDIIADLSRFRLIHGVPKLPKLKTNAMRPEAVAEKRHADAAIAIAMLEYATTKAVFEVAYEKVAKRTGLFVSKGMGL